jgi:protein-tyrosine-phosphatase
MRILKVLVSVVVVLLVAFAVMYAMGSALPTDHVTTIATTMPASQERVWQMITDMKSQPGWRTGLKGVEPWPSTDGKECWLEVQNGMKMPLCADLSEPPMKRVVSIADTSLPFSGTWTYELQPKSSTESTLSITERASTRTPMWRFVGHYVIGEDTAIKQYESDLKKALTAQTSPVSSTPQVLFVCQHGNVKSLMAASYFNQMAQQRGLAVRAVARGTAPNSDTVPSPIAQSLQGDGFDVSEFHPSAVSAADVSSSRRVITIGTTLPGDAQAAPLKLEAWNDVPPADADYGATRTSLKSHIDGLLNELSRP